MGSMIVPADRKCLGLWLPPKQQELMRDREFNRMDSYVARKLRRWQYRRGGQRPTKRPPFTGQQLYGMGLHRLMGTVCYPMQATPRRSSVSRVPENGMHGLTGGQMAQGRF